MAVDATHRTILAPPLLWSADAVKEATTLYRMARDKVLELRDGSSPSRSGYWVFHPGTGGMPLGFVPDTAGAHSIMGRHPRVDLKVSEEYESFSLRQTLLRARRVEDQLVLNVMDLESPSGIVISSGETVRALDAMGPFATYIGGLMLMFVPEDPQQELPETLPVPEIRGFSERKPRPGSGSFKTPERQALPPPSLSTMRSGTLSCVHKIAGLQRMEMGSIIPAAPYANHTVSVDLDLARQDGGCAFHLTSRKQVVGTLVLNHEQLEHGVLLGRYDRCQELGSHRLGAQVSRVHALLILERGALRIFDLGSTHGVKVDDEVVRSSTLMRHQRVELSGELALRVLFTSVPSIPPPPPQPELVS